ELRIPDLRVDLRRVEPRVPEERLDVANVRPLPEEVRREQVSEPMRHALGDLRRRPPARRAPLDGLPPPARAILLRQQEVARVEPRPREHVVAPDREEARGDRHDAHLAPLPTRRRRITSAAALVPRRSVTAAGSCVEVDANLL